MNRVYKKRVAWQPSVNPEAEPLCEIVCIFILCR